MKPLFYILLISVWIGLLGCDQQDDCIGCNLNPKIKINLDVTQTKAKTDSLLTQVKDSITLLTDSLAGSLSADIRALINTKIEELRSDSLSLEDKYALLRLGKVQAISIDAVGGAAGFEQFQDSIFRNFSIPVDMHHDTTTYFINLFGEQDTLELVYKRDFKQNLDGVRMTLSDIDVNEANTTFDSVRVRCYNSNCGNDLTTVYIYF